jgi:uncharacterized protein (DUF4415 family)
MSRTAGRRTVRLLDATEEAELQEQIAADPEAPEATTAELATMRRAGAVLPADLFKALTKRGRPRAENKRVMLTLRVDPGVVEAYKATGAGWQTRMNEVLARGAKRLSNSSQALESRREVVAAAAKPAAKGGKSS